MGYRSSWPAPVNLEVSSNRVLQISRDPVLREEPEDLRGRSLQGQRHRDLVKRIVLLPRWRDCPLVEIQPDFLCSLLHNRLQFYGSKSWIIAADEACFGLRHILTGLL